MALPRSHIRILVVEDYADLREALLEALDEYGFVTVAARNGREALEHLRRMDDEPPAVILLDLAMPVMDGPSFRSAQLADPSFQDIPVILVTAQDDVQQVAADLGVSAFLRKPVRLLPLLEALRDLGVQ